MKSRILIAWLALTAAAFAADAPRPPETKDARKLLQEGLFEEEASRDLVKAAAAYQNVITRYGEDRVFAATALFRLAEIRIKEGKNPEAVTLLQRLAMEFPDQTALLADTQKRLTALGAPVPAFPANTPQHLATLREKLAELQVKVASLSGSLKPGHPQMVALRAEIAAIESVLNRSIGPVGGATTEGPGTAEERAELVRVQELVKNSPDLIEAAAVGQDGLTPLKRAASKGWMEVATYLLDHGAVVDHVALRGAASGGHKRMVELLLARGADPNNYSFPGLSPLLVACQENRTEVVRLLLEKGTKPDPSLDVLKQDDSSVDATPLLVAVARGNTRLVPLLLQAGANVELAAPSAGVTPLARAVSTGNLEMVTLLLDAGAKVDAQMKDGATPLSLACAKADLKLATLLLSRGAKPDLADAEGITPLHHATGRSEALTRLLLDAGASPRAVTKQGGTPWHTSIHGRDFHGARNLVDHHTQNRSRLSALNSLAFTDARLPAGFDKELPVIWELLLAKGAEINAQDVAGATPLHLAVAAFSTTEQSAWLLEHGADLNIKTANGVKPLDFADGPKRLELERRFVYPTLAGGRAIHVFLRIGSPVSEADRIEPVTDYDSPPSANELLALALAKEGKKNALFPASFDIVVYRKSGPELMKEVSRTANTPATKAPVVEWGDVVVVESNGGTMTSIQTVISQAAENLPMPPRTVTLSVDDREEQMVLSSGKAFAFGFQLSRPGQNLVSVNFSNPKATWWPGSSAPTGWRLGDVLERVAQGEPRAQLEAVKLVRKDSGQTREWTIDARAQRSEARLADGDRVIVPLLPANAPGPLAERRQGIYRAAAGRATGERVFTLPAGNPRPHTLGELLMQSYLQSRMVVPSPELGKIIIHRLKGDAGEEEHLPIDLAAIIRNLAHNAPAEEARRMDVQLQWGDVVEIPETKEGDPKTWTGFDVPTRHFLARALTRTVKVSVNGETMAPEVAPEFITFDYRAGTWQRNRANESQPFRVAQLFRQIHSGRVWTDRVVRVTIRSGDTKREFDSKGLTEAAPWLFPDDLVEVEALDD